MVRTALLLILLSTLSSQSVAFNLPGSSPIKRGGAARHDAKVLAQVTAPNLVADAWSKYVLLRPGMTYEELKLSTLSPLGDDRTPGTVRTILLSSILVFAASVPHLLASPWVLPKLIELAALSRTGVTPACMLEKTGSFF